MIDTLLGTLGTAAGTAGAVLGAFWKYEDVASADAKLKVTQWLKYSGPGTDHPGWADHLIVAFNKIFGERHFSFKCFYRSCIASIIAVACTFMFWVIYYPDAYHSWIESDLASGTSENVERVVVGFTVIVVALIINSVPDYFSYMKTRLILQKIIKVNSAIRILGFAVLDTALSLLMWLVPMLLVGVLVMKQPLSSFNINELFSLEPEKGNVPPAIFTFAALFVSAWSWLYAISALATRLMLKLFPKLQTTTVRLFDVDAHPLRSLGCVAGGIVFVAMLGLKLVD